MGSPTLTSQSITLTTITMDLHPSVSQARQFECRYAPCIIPLMPPPTEWPVVDASVALLLARATNDVHKYYGVLRTSKEEGKRLVRTFPIPFVLFPNKTTDQYKAAFLQRTKPHYDAARKRSQRMNFALGRARKLVSGNTPPCFFTLRFFR